MTKALPSQLLVESKLLFIRQVSKGKEEEKGIYQNVCICCMSGPPHMLLS